MASTKPYFIRAVFEWCLDEGFTPYLAVQVDSRTRVPLEFVKDGQIVLNIGPDATHQMQISNDEVTFQARFNGVAFPVLVPVDAVIAIYARENGQGMAFEFADKNSEADRAITAVETAEMQANVAENVHEVPVKRGSHLTRIK